MYYLPGMYVFIAEASRVRGIYLTNLRYIWNQAPPSGLMISLLTTRLPV